MAKRKDGSGWPSAEQYRGMVYTMPGTPEQKFLWGLGALAFGLASIRFAPKIAQKLIPILTAAFTPLPGQIRKVNYHPEGMEPIETVIDERQLGRSEVIREIAKPRRN